MTFCRTQISSDLLKRLLQYDPELGSFTWRERTPDLFNSSPKNREALCAGWNAKYANRPAFEGRDTDGYARASILGVRLSAHRVAWTIMTGEWPSELIDHINGIPHDNRWANLRAASPSQNARNVLPRKGSSSGFLGVTFHSKTGKWQAQIKSDGKNKYLGVFQNEIDAARAYDSAALGIHGDFARLNFEQPQ